MSTLREWLSGERIHHTHVERVAKLIWEMEGGNYTDWFNNIDEYRRRARLVLSEPQGWMNGGK